jgi:murein L,D-transpeptidase YafK
MKKIFLLVSLIPAQISFASGEMIFLSVDKTKLKAELRTLPEKSEQSQVLRTFRIATGKVEGDKEKMGDNKTPEGIYFTLNSITEKLPAEKYGPLAIPLNFPNPIDQLQGKTGYGIWLHGAGKDERIEEAKVTEGCVAFYNAEITGLKKWLNPQQGLVVISTDSSTVNNPADVADVKLAATRWIQSWAERDIDSYMSYYADNFENAGKDKAAYKTYKKSVFSAYKSMIVSMTGLRAVTHPKYALTVMNQDFNGDNRFRSDGRKILYWQKSPSGAWTIVRELFDSQRLRTVEFSAEDIVTSREGQTGSSASTAASNASRNL